MDAVALGKRRRRKRRKGNLKRERERGQPCASARFPGLFRYSDMSTSQEGRRVEVEVEGRTALGCPAGRRFSTAASAARHGSMEEAIAPIAFSASSQSSSLH